MIYGEVAQKAREAISSSSSSLLLPLKKWPKEVMEKWGPWVAYILFLTILLWEELWDLPNTAALSASLLLLITSGAMLCSLIYERRLWCRYLCPIGAMNGKEEEGGRRKEEGGGMLVSPIGIPSCLMTDDDDGDDE